MIVAAFAKPAPKDGKEAVLTKSVTVDSKPMTCLAVADEKVKIQHVASPLYNCSWVDGEVIVVIGEDKDFAAIVKQYGEPIKPDEKGIIPGMVGSITTAINEIQPDGTLKARQITLQGEPEIGITPDKMELP